MQLDQPFQLKDAPIDVLSIGELLIDMISDSYLNLIDNNKFRAYFGGSPANICMNVNRLGAKSKLVSAVGDDVLGDFLIEHLNKQSVNTELIQRSSQSTSMVVLNKSKETPIPIFYRGSDYQIKLTDQLSKSIKQTKIIHFSSWPLSKYESRKVVYEIIKLAKQENVLIGFDPNYHSELWDNPVEGIEIMKEMIGKADIVKPSEDDAERLFGPDTAENQIDKFHQLGCPTVLMTLGKDGAIVSLDRKKTYYKTMAKQIIDTTGAGDAFWSGFYTGITLGETVEKALTIGFLASAYKLQFTGAVVELPHYRDLLVSEINV
ncbi:carbohydrate kinase [Amphibacillus indicireducens]|uniref:Carbohydrate kinase n=1 Tax=Amphibacillus indicireducens TaxID=1076330 RepID=A0ABP7VME6_9BACI